MQRSTFFFLLAGLDIYVAGIHRYDITPFLGPLSPYSAFLLTGIGLLLAYGEETPNYSFVLDDGESLIWSHTSPWFGVAYALTSEKLIFVYLSELESERCRKHSAWNINFPEATETKINRKDIVKVGVDKNKFREVVYVELANRSKIHLPIMGNKKDELLKLLTK